MKIHVLAAGLALGLGGLLLGTGCSQQDTSQQTGAVMEEKLKATDGVARKAATAPATGSPEVVTGELLAEAPVMGADGVVEDEVVEQEITIQPSSQKDRNAYYDARARAKNAFRDAVERRNR